MRLRPLGKTNLSVPVMMLGGNVFGWTVNEADSFRLLDRAFDLGLTFIDTADVYSRWVPGHIGGESETIIGKWFKQTGKRDRVIIATKLGIDMGDGKAGLSARRIREAVDESLSRLQTDRIDLYQSHRDDENTPLEETLEAYTRSSARARCASSEPPTTREPACARPSTPAVNSVSRLTKRCSHTTIWSNAGPMKPISRRLSTNTGSA